MKRIIFILALVAAFAFESKAQKFALIDMEYILKNIPSYEMANEQLKQVSQRWEKEITTQAQKVESMYKEYQSNSVFLSDDQKKKKEEEIVANAPGICPARRRPVQVRTSDVPASAAVVATFHSRQAVAACHQIYSAT